MKNYIKYIGILALGMVACEPEFENPVDANDAYTSGEADFSTYVALGNSLTSGTSDNALFIQGQQNSFPNILAQQFAKAGGGDFTQPLMADNYGGLLLNGTQITNTRLVLAFDAEGNAMPTNLNAEPTTEVSNTLSGPFNNMGVPGAKSFHLLSTSYGDITGVEEGTANPYYVRFASSSNASVLQDALEQDPTFFSLWIGGNDVFTYASTGGIGVDRTGNPDYTAYQPYDITDPALFESVYNNLVTSLTAEGAEGVLLNVPDVTDVPFFTTVPNNALVLNAEQAAGLTSYFQAVAGIFAQYLMQTQGLSAEQANAVAAQYAITFNEGPNRFIIDVPVTQMNPLGFRQMTEEELLLLTIDRGALAQQGYGSAAISAEVMAVLQKLQTGGQPTQEEAQLVLDAVNGINDGDALDSEELSAIETARQAYNQVIENAAAEHNLAFVDAAELLNNLNTQGYVFDEGVLNSDFVTGGAFSLDGFHLTARGYAFVANNIIDAINQTYNSSVPKVNIGNYGTFQLSNEIQ